MRAVMNANRHASGLSGQESGSRRAATPSMSVEWAALQDAAAAVAAMAGLAPERISPDVRNFPAVIRDIGGSQLELAEQNIADIGAMMRPGLTALLAVRARGQDATAPALTLWQEYHFARTALLALIPRQSNHGPRRAAG